MPEAKHWDMRPREVVELRRGARSLTVMFLFRDTAHACFEAPMDGAGWADDAGTVLTFWLREDGGLLDEVGGAWEIVLRRPVDTTSRLVSPESVRAGRGRVHDHWAKGAW